MVRRWRFFESFCVVYFQRAACSTFQTCLLNSHYGHATHFSKQKLDPLLTQSVLIFSFNVTAPSLPPPPERVKDGVMDCGRGVLIPSHDQSNF